MAFSVSPTPSYPSLDYSKGPRSAYYTNENYLKLFLNVPQTDEDDEWGRTGAITLRSLVDHVTDIWVNLYGSTPTSGGGIAGNNTEILKIVDVTNSRIVFPKGTGPASANTTSTTIIDENGFTFDLAKTTGYFCDSLSLSSGNGYLELDSSNTVIKYVKAHSLSNFYLGFIRASGSVNSIRLAVPTGGSDTETSIYDFGETTVSFPSYVSVSMGATTVTTLNVSTGNFTDIKVNTDLDILDGQISYCSSQSATDPKNWMLTSYLLVIGPDNSSEQRIELNNTNGLLFYCGTGGLLSGRFNDTGIFLYKNGVQTTTISQGTSSEGNVSIFKLHDGAELNFIGTSAGSRLTHSFTDKFKVYDYDDRDGDYVEITKSSFKFYDDDELQLGITKNSIAKGSVGFSFDDENNLITVSTSSSGYISLIPPSTEDPNGGVFLYYCASNGVELTTSGLKFVTEGTQELSVLSDRLEFHEGPYLRFLGVVDGAKYIFAATNDLKVLDPESTSDYTSIKTNSNTSGVYSYISGTLEGSVYSYSGSFKVGQNGGVYLTYSKPGEYYRLKIETEDPAQSSLQIMVSYLPKDSASVTNQLIYKEYSDLSAADKVVVWNG